MSDQAQRQGRLSPPTDRVIEVLEAVAAEPTRRWLLTELATHCRLTKSTCLGIVNVLVDRGYLARRPGGVVLGEGFSRLSAATDVRFVVVERARPHLLPFAERGAIVGLSRAHPEGLQILDIFGPLMPQQRLRPMLYPYVMPIRSFVAWAAWYPETFVEQRLRQAGHIDPQVLERARAQIARARAEGFCLLRSSPAMSRLYHVLATLQDPLIPDSVRREMHEFLEEVSLLLDREPAPGEAGATIEVFAPVFGPDSEVIAVILLLTTDQATLGAGDASTAGTAVRDAARAISAELRGTDPGRSPAATTRAPSRRTP